MGQRAATIIRDARLRAALTQSELAAIAGIQQSVVSSYESGAREPGFATLTRLVAAAGFDLGISFEPAPPRSALRARVERHGRRLVRELRGLGASNVRLFGSVARGDDGPDSDVDLLVDIAEGTGLFALGQMRTAAERLLEAPVDIVPALGLKPEVAERVLAEAIAL